MGWATAPTGLADESGASSASSESHKASIADLPQTVQHKDRDEANAQANEPRTYVDENGFTVQPVPSDDEGYNITYLNADNRGCTSCHSLEDVMLNMPTYHGLTFMGYPTEQNYANCFVCHEWATPLRTSIHALHNSSEAFKSMGGTCESCHYIDGDGNFTRWDYEKYDLYKGYTDIAADDADANIQVEYDQDTLTDVDQMFYKSIKSYGDFDPTNWRTDDSAMDPDLYNNWVFTVGGEVANPISMTLPELEEKFGTTTTVMKQQCTVNGVGNAMIFQVEVTGVPLKAILDYVQPNEGTNCIDVETEDPYPDTTKNYHSPLNTDDAQDAILVTQINGQTLPNSQGYPVSLWFPRGSAAEAYKVVTGVDIITTSEDDAKTGHYLGDFEDPAVQTAASKPNSGVLNYPTGVVLSNQAGKEVALEGFADAWDEPIEKIEYSLDGGKSWLELDTPNNDPKYWTYWRLTFTPPNEGTYLLNIRTTSIKPDGTERTCAWNTQFLLNVR